MLSKSLIFQFTVVFDPVWIGSHQLNVAVATELQSRNGIRIHLKPVPYAAPSTFAAMELCSYRSPVVGKVLLDSITQIMKLVMSLPIVVHKPLVIHHHDLKKISHPLFEACFTPFT